MCYIPPKGLFDRIWCFCQVGKLQLVNVLDLEVSHVQSPFHWFACQGKIRTKGQLFKVFMNMSWTYSEHTCIQYTHMYIYVLYILYIYIYIYVIGLAFWKRIAGNLQQVKWQSSTHYWFPAMQKYKTTTPAPKTNHGYTSRLNCAHIAIHLYTYILYVKDCSMNINKKSNIRYI